MEMMGFLWLRNQKVTSYKLKEADFSVDLFINTFPDYRTYPSPEPIPVKVSDTAIGMRMPLEKRYNPQQDYCPEKSNDKISDNPSGCVQPDQAEQPSAQKAAYDTYEEIDDQSESSSSHHPAGRPASNDAYNYKP